MTTESPQAAGRIDTPSPAWRPRIRFAMRLRTMLLVVLAVAVVLGYRDYRKRRDAIDYLVSRVPISVYIRTRPTFPDHDSTWDPGGTYGLATRRVRELHLEREAVSDLVVALRKSRISGDEKSILGALAAIQGLGTGLEAAGPDVARVIRGEGLSKDRLGEFTDARALAVHVLAMIAKQGEEQWISTLIEALALEDPSPDGMLRASAANELAAFGPKAREAVPAILAIMDARAERRAHEAGGAKPGRPTDLTRFEYVEWLLGAIGPDARPAMPRLTSIVLDPSEDSRFRCSALSAVVGILWPRQPDQAIPKELVALLVAAAEDDDQSLRRVASAHLRGVESQMEMMRRRQAMKLMIAADRARGGRPRPRSAPNPEPEAPK